MTLRTILNKIGLAICVFIIVSPAIFFFLWMLSLSVKYEIDNAASPPVFIPDRFAWQNYVDVLTSNRFVTYFFNTLIVTGSATLAALLVGVPAGDVNGLPFVYGAMQLAADPSGVSISRGAVLVGTTATSFSAVARPSENAIDVDAPRADLSDFNNFFDTGDTLDGNGRVKIAAASRGGSVTSSGNIDVRRFRYRNLPVGDT